MPKRILIIDDEVMVLDALKAILEALGYLVDAFSEPLAGEQAGIDGEYDLILSDLRMPGRNGADVVESVLQRHPQARILVITAFPSDPLADKALAHGAIGLVPKPFEISKIVEYLGPAA